MTKPKPVRMINGERWFTVEEAAKRLGVTQKKVRVMMGDGTLEWDQPTTGGHLRIRAVDVFRILLDRIGKR
jgi:excisionase family DNA binding protein